MDFKDVIDLIDTGTSAVIALALIFRIDRHLQSQTRLLSGRLDKIDTAMREMMDHARKRATTARRNTPREVPIREQ
jgi:hypothetical protein